MQETEILVDMEHLFTTALVRTYQNDELIDLYRVLREMWQEFRPPGEESPALGKADAVLHQVEDTCLSLETRGHLSGAEREIVACIRLRCSRLGEEIACNWPGILRARSRSGIPRAQCRFDSLPFIWWDEEEPRP